MANKKDSSYAMFATDPKRMALTTGIMTALTAPLAMRSTVQSLKSHKNLLLKNPALARSAMRKLQALSLLSAVPVGALFGLRTAHHRDIHAKALAARRTTGKLRKSEVSALSRMGIKA